MSDIEPKKGFLDQLLDAAETVVGAAESALPEALPERQIEGASTEAGIIDVEAIERDKKPYSWRCVRELEVWTWHAFATETIAVCGKPFTPGLFGPQRLTGGNTKGLLLACAKCITETSRMHDHAMVIMGVIDG